MKTYPAHIRKENEEFKIQSVEEHLRGTAEIAADDLKSVGLSNTAYLAGLVHDLGKYTDDYADYINRASKGEDVRRGSVNHTFAGVNAILDKYHEGTNAVDQLLSEIIAYAAGAHHGQFDCINKDGESGFEYRRKKKENFDGPIKTFYETCSTDNEISQLRGKASQEIKDKIGVIQNATKDISDKEKRKSERQFYIGFLARLVLSALVDGDRTDTANFMIGVENKEKFDHAGFWKPYLDLVEEKIKKLPADTPINQARAKISGICRNFAANKPGVYRLNIPTGGGKTLSSLRYALAHADLCNKDRIIYTAPFLSIIDQNASVMRDYIDDDSIILEHHSNVVKDKDNVEDDNYKYLTETWNAPVVITTLVQLLNTLFDGSLSSVRRMQSLCNSVLIIDEYQSVPLKMSGLFNLAINFLSMCCDTTVILCSATHPNDKASTHEIIYDPDVKDIVPYDPELWSVFKRTDYEVVKEKFALTDIPAFILNIYDQSQNVLVVCNTKKEAKYLFEELRGAVDKCYHLSAGMCMAHRKDVLEGIKKSLANKEKIVCVSTQVIEAGVDISFQTVIRFAAGLESIVQSGGRGNRNGEYGKTEKTYIICCEEEKVPDEIKMSRKAFEDMTVSFEKHPEKYDNRIDSDEAINDYYVALSQETAGRNCGKYQDYVIPATSKTMFDLLSTNPDYIAFYRGPAYHLKQAFLEAGNEFHVFPEDKIDVFVPYMEGADYIEDLRSAIKNNNFDVIKTILTQLKPYTVGIYSKKFEEIEAAGGVEYLLDDRIAVLDTRFYNEHVGVVDEAPPDGIIC